MNILNIKLIIVICFSLTLLSEPSLSQELSFVQSGSLTTMNEVERRLLREEIEIVDLTTDVSGVLPVDNGGTGQDFSGAVEGEVPYFSATGVMSVLGTGTSGDFLQTQGANNPPIWATVPHTNAWELKQSTAIAENETTVTITQTIADGEVFKIIVEGELVGSGTTGIWSVRINQDSTGNDHYYAARKSKTTDFITLTSSDMIGSSTSIPIIVTGSPADVEFYIELIITARISKTQIKYSVMHQNSASLNFSERIDGMAIYDGGVPTIIEFLRISGSTNDFGTGGNYYVYQAN